MRLSTYHMPTLKEAPADAEVISHKLLVRAGMIRKLTSGLYSFLPFGLRVLNKVGAIVREEMDRAGAMEVLMPVAQPADLWRESGRWEVYGKELLRFTDRGGREYCLGPTHEEVITDLVRHEIRSYRDLPRNLYQVQTKFRDEMRPRFGLMRCREFIMKDAYSFDRDEAGAEASYRAMYDAYTRAFTRLGMRFRPVEADSGPIGGSFSHEFMVLADTGEDTIAVCRDCEFAANLEKAEVVLPEPGALAAAPSLEEVATPGAHTVDELAAFLKIPASGVVKTLVYVADGKPVAALVRGDRELNEVKLKNLLGVVELELADPDTVKEVSGAPVGFAGPVGLKVTRILADAELRLGTDWAAGANKADAHVLHLDLTRDAEVERYADLRVITAEDPCPRCNGSLELTKGIEVGHVFKLGTKYSEAMNARYLDEDGRDQPMVMGCYGIGVSRIVAACIEQNHDDWGIVFPPSMAPCEAVVLCLDPKDDQVMAKAEEVYARLGSMGVDAALDDRAERPGVKFKDADLVGFPMQLVIGGKGLGRGVMEAKDRRTGEKTELPAEDFAQALADWREGVLAGWRDSMGSRS